MAKTKKVKTTGRYKARYGVGIRKKLLKVEPQQYKKHTCPRCGFKKLKRLASGIFQCRKCSAKIAGGAYFPATMTGTIVRKIISQKSFGTASVQMLEQTVQEKEDAAVKESKEESGMERKEKEK